MSRAEWLAALQEAVRVESTTIWLPVAAVRDLRGGLYYVEYNTKNVRRGALHGAACRLDSSVEGGACFVKPTGGADHALDGVVRTVVEGEGALTLDRKAGRPPAPQDGLTIRPPSFLRPALAWLEEHPELGAGDKGPDGAILERLAAPHATAPKGGAAAGAGPGGMKLRQRQAEALALTGAPLGVCWGPPGTGKTTTLAALVARLVARGERVLVVAPTRVAADGACLAIDKQWPAEKARRRGDLLRTQLPQLASEFAAQRPDLLIWADEERAFGQAQVDLLRADGEARRDILIRSGLARDEALVRAASAAESIEALRGVWEQRQLALVRDAQVVVSTVRSAVNRGQAGQFKHLIVDEASMVSRSDGLLLLAQQVNGGSCLLFGDHKQLGPVPPLFDNAGEGEASEKKGATQAQQAPWFEADILSTVMAKPGAPGRTVMLDEQSRMNPALCAIVSAQSYGGDLKATAEAPDGGLLPGLPSGVCLLDPTVQHPGLSLPVLQNIGGFYPGVQPESARATVALARLLHDCGVSVVVCSPFRGQATLIGRGLADLQHLRAGTIHRMQGQEASVCIFDPGQAASWFIKNSDAAPRLVNVAASRAKDVLVISNAAEFVAKNPLLRPYLDVASRLTVGVRPPRQPFVSPAAAPQRA